MIFLEHHRCFKLYFCKNCVESDAKRTDKFYFLMGHTPSNLYFCKSCEMPQQPASKAHCEVTSLQIVLFSFRNLWRSNSMRQLALALVFWSIQKMKALKILCMFHLWEWTSERKSINNIYWLPSMFKSIIIIICLGGFYVLNIERFSTHRFPHIDFPYYWHWWVYRKSSFLFSLSFPVSVLQRFSK